MFRISKSLLAAKAKALFTPRARPSLESLETRAVPSAATFRVAAEIVGSPENTADFVTNEFALFLHRAPDPAGFNFFVAQMERGMSPEAVEAVFASSTEDFLNHGGDPRTWLTGLYNDLLGRAPDAAGFSHWLNNLAGGESRLQVALGFSTGLERESDVIRQDYLNFLGRTPDSNGLNHWLSAIQLGSSRAFVASEILSSNESFQVHGGTNTGYVIAAFTQVLGRTPSTTELISFLSQL
jgi:hypothetical protein